MCSKHSKTQKKVKRDGPTDRVTYRVAYMQLKMCATFYWPQNWKNRGHHPFWSLFLIYMQNFGEGPSFFSQSLELRYFSI